jgi:transglutaminase-like putative cysteine protease
MTYRTATTQTAWARTRSRSSYWLLYLLALAAVVCLPLSIRASGWVPEANRLIWAAFWGLGVGFLIAQARVPDWMTWLGSMILGVEYSLQYAAKLVPGFSMLLNDAGSAAEWLWRTLVLQNPGPPLPFARSVAYSATHLDEFIANLSAWAGAAQAGTASEDITVLWIVVSLAVWLLSWHVGYELIRQRRPFAALLPLGVALVSNVSFTDRGLTYVHVYLAITLATLVIANIDRLERLWQRLGLDFSPELRRDTLLAGIGITVVVLLVALLMPYRTWNDAAWFFWNRVGPKVEQFYDRLDKAFAGRDPVPEPTPDPSLAAMSGHLISSGLGGDQDTLFTVEVSDPRPPDERELIAMYNQADISQFVPKRYWRQRTYDVYTGSGWETSGHEAAEYEAGADWTAPGYAGDEVTQTITFVELEPGLAPAVNMPVRVEDQPYAIVVRGEDDMTALVVNAEQYTVVSMAPKPTAGQLWAAEDAYPDWVANKYLALPEVPQAVTDLAQQLVDEAGATTRYDKALVIQEYLRRFVYDLEVEPPPLDRDVVEYFLFEAQRGYCDYTATAMVVMLRSVGVASRYAQGFGQGRFDYDAGVYVVTDQNRHAWPEVYFPALGWVEFEPTPILSVWTRPVSSADLVGQPVAAAGDEQPRGVPRIFVWAAILAGVVLFVIIWPPRHLRRRSSDPREAIIQTYGRLVRAARWINLEPQGGQTPGEYLRYLAAQLETRGDYGGAARQDVRVIDSLYQVARYSQRPLAPADSLRAESAWSRLNAGLWRAWLKRPKRGPTT